MVDLLSVFSFHAKGGELYPSRLDTGKLNDELCRRAYKSGIFRAFKSGQRFLAGCGRPGWWARGGFGRREDEAEPKSGGLGGG